MERIGLNWWATSKQNFSVRIFSTKTEVWKKGQDYQN